MRTISANILKKQGISSISGDSETLVTVRGEARYVILDMDAYNHLRELELMVAVMQAKQEIQEGSYVKESVAAHMQRISEE